MTSTSMIEETVAGALPALRRMFPSLLSLDEPTALKQSERSLVLRCALLSGATAAPATVIIKKILAREECGFSDWSSLDFIGRHPEWERLAPRFHGGDTAARIYAMEDLGGSASIDDILRADDEAAAVAALMKLVEECARLQRLTSGGAYEEEFTRIRSPLPGAGEIGRRREGERWLTALDRLEAWFTPAGVKIDGRFREECERLNAHYVEPGALLAFTHGDIAPSNNHVRDGEVRLVDFEYGGFRHALYDMAVWNVLCPLPEPLLAGLLERYRTCFISGEGGMAGVEFSREWEMICVWRGIGMLGWFTPTIMEQDRPWVEEWSARNAVLRTVRMITRHAARRGEMAGIAASMEALAGALAARWPEADGGIPRWRALRRMEVDRRG